jgi:hypothetical protein
MKRGRKSLVLTPHNRRRLMNARLASSRRLNCPVGFPQLKLVMGAPFSWETLQRACAGNPIWADYHEFIVAWLDAHFPDRRAPAPDFKRAAAHDAPDPKEEPAEQTPEWPTLPDEIAERTFRGSR